MIRRISIFAVGLIAVLALGLAAWGYFGQNRARMDAREEKLYHALCGYEGNDDTLRDLLASYPDLNVPFSGSPETPLSVALGDNHACGTHLSKIEILIKAGADVNLKGLEGPPLILAVLSNRPDAVEHLLKSGADVNGVDDAGYTAAMRVWNSNEKQRREMLRLLIDAGIDLNRKGADGLTARDIAVKYGGTDLVQMIDQALKR